MKLVKSLAVPLVFLMLWAACPTDAHAGETDKRRDVKIRDYRRGHRPRDARRGHHHTPRKHDRAHDRK